MLPQKAGCSRDSPLHEEEELETLEVCTRRFGRSTVVPVSAGRGAELARSSLVTQRE